MISVSIEKKEGRYYRLRCKGHANYAKAGDDIVCAAASILVINTLNAIEKLLSENFSLEVDQEQGLIDARFDCVPSDGAALLIEAMEMGLVEISRQYGKKYISLQIEEATS